jgi:hypothetical protein
VRQASTSLSVALLTASVLAVWSSALVSTTTQAAGADPVRRIAIYVEPYYRAGQTNNPPTVHVGARYDALLASNRQTDILAARDLINSNPEFVTPMTLMVLAIRLYDVGLRDDAVFWFYVAKDRYSTLAAVIGPDVPALEQSAEAMRAFSALAGPVINGYAFCNLSRQKETRLRALAWVESHPYGAIFSELPAHRSDRQAALAEAVQIAKDNAEKERRYLDDPTTREPFLATRKANAADARFCWD